jgi:hypothetical protein
VILIGVLGNGLTVYVLRNRSTFSSGNTYLRGMALADFAFLSFGFTVHQLPRFFKDALSTSLTYWSLYPYLLWVTDASDGISLWIMTLFTVERFLAVRFPLSRMNQISGRRATTIVTFIFLFFSLTTVTTTLEWEAVEMGLNEKNETTFSIGITELGANETVASVIYWYSIFAFSYIPLPVIVTLNLALIHFVRKAARDRRSMVPGSKSRSKEERQVTITLLAIVTVFFTCQAPTALVTLLLTTTSLGTSKRAKTWALIRTVNNICNLLVKVNTACNFILYAILCRQYRALFINALLCRGVHGRNVKVQFQRQSTQNESIELSNLNK